MADPTGSRFSSFESSGMATGIVQQITLHSPALGRRGDISLYAPAGTDPEDPLPLVLLLHGVYGSHWSWHRQGDAPAVLDALCAVGAVRPCLLAMPSDGLFGIGSGYVRNGDEDAEGWIVDDVPDAIRLVHPGAGARGTAIAGLSMGGTGALRLAARHPDRFVSAAALSPLPSVASIAAFTGRPDDSPAPAGDEHDLVAELTRWSAGREALWLGCGTEDELVDEALNLHERLVHAGAPHRFSATAGDHDWHYWRRALRDVLQFFDGRW